MTNQIGKIKTRSILIALLALLISFVIHLNLAIALFLSCLFAYFMLRRLPCRILNLTLIYLIIFTISYHVLRHEWQMYYLPFALGGMLTTLLFNNLEISLLITLSTSASIASFSNYSWIALLFLISGVLSSILVLDARKRSTVIRAGFIVGIAQTITLLLYDPPWVGLHYKIHWPAYAGFVINGLATGIIVLGILPIFEYLFKTITNISLLELFEHPLLERMKLEAPGTYNHSLIVGNMSETACRQIGANALLARVGAYYHDIGKLSKPDYFSENYEMQGSKHDNLSPSMSKIIIMNHVKEGLELAKKFKLNTRLIDFIAQHHGKSLVYYFYRRALESLEDDQEVREEGFRYPGPKPNTKETAIVLLADSTEAATRALQEPSPSKIEEIVHQIINNKFIDGQLDECDLTLKDLEKISAVFIRILNGIYQGRVSYSEEPRSEDNNNKPAKKDSHPSDKDKKDNS